MNAMASPRQTQHTKGPAGIRTESGSIHSKLLFQMIKVLGDARLQGAALTRPERYGA